METYILLKVTPLPPPPPLSTSVVDQSPSVCLLSEYYSLNYTATCLNSKWRKQINSVYQILMIVEIIAMYRLYSSLRYGDSRHNSLFSSIRGSVMKGIIVYLGIFVSSIFSPTPLSPSPRITSSLITLL